MKPRQPKNDPQNPKSYICKEHVYILQETTTVHDISIMQVATA